MITEYKSTFYSFYYLNFVQEANTLIILHYFSTEETI